MDKDILNTFIIAASFIALFGVAELLYHALKIKVELTRKLVHVGTGLLTFLFPILIGNHWLVLILCLSFALILQLSFRFNLLRSINAIERESVGSIAYPISVYGCYLAYDYFNRQIIYFYLPIIILAICDPIAALSGNKWPIGKYRVGKEYKTMMGSCMFFFSAFAIVIIFLKGYESGKALLIGVSIALIATLSEALSRKGYDNITIPAAVILSLIIILHLF
ncbi:MAG: phosphatidate cytidylyltransferase [Saprospiraceae bacterium]|nr:phosphatidate cytidylyltransferase [Candidatus Vicinibacter affinis]